MNGGRIRDKRKSVIPGCGGAGGWRRVELDQGLIKHFPEICDVPSFTKCYREKKAFCDFGKHPD